MSSYWYFFQGPKEGAIHDVHRATLCWKPLDEKKRLRREESKYTYHFTSAFADFHFLPEGFTGLSEVQATLLLTEVGG